MGEWISVKDKRKPACDREEGRISRHILLYLPTWRADAGEGVCIGVYIKSLDEFRPSNSLNWEKAVTHWQSLPDPPAA